MFCHGNIFVSLKIYLFFRGSWKKNLSGRKSEFATDAVQVQTTGVTSMTIQEHARIQAASRYQPSKQTATINNNVAVLQTESKTDDEDGNYFNKSA